MKKTYKIVAILVLIVALIGIVAGCSETLAFNKITAIKDKTLEKVIIRTGDNYKIFTAEKYLDETIAAMDAAKFKKDDLKVKHEKGTYVIEFYFKDTQGHISYSLNGNFTAVDGCKVNIKKADYYLENYDDIKKIVGDLYYSGLNA